MNEQADTPDELPAIQETGILPDNPSEADMFLSLKLRAWNNRNLELFDFLNGVQNDLKQLRLVCSVIAKMYQRGANDETWNALFEALFDAGLLNTEFD